MPRVGMDRERDRHGGSTGRFMQGTPANSRYFQTCYEKNRNPIAKNEDRLSPKIFT